MNVKDALFEAYYAGFMLEHGAKDVSRYPLAGPADVVVKPKLREAFDDWYLRNVTYSGEIETKS